jgi:hypothetical protein
MIEEHLAALTKSAVAPQPREVVVQVRQCDDDALRFARAAACEEDVERVVVPEGLPLVVHGGVRRDRRDLRRRQHHFGSGDLDDPRHALLGRGVIDRHVGSPRFYRREKSNQHLGFLVSMHCDGRATVAELRIKPCREGVAFCEQFAVRHPAIATDVRQSVRRLAAELLNSVEQMHG